MLSHYRRKNVLSDCWKTDCHVRWRIDSSRVWSQLGKRIFANVSAVSIRMRIWPWGGGGGYLPCVPGRMWKNRHRLPFQLHWLIDPTIVQFTFAGCAEHLILLALIEAPFCKKVKTHPALKRQHDLEKIHHSYSIMLSHYHRRNSRSFKMSA